jgi:hypothetical protein
MKKIWNAKAEQKSKMFVWILLQNKILTADNLAKRSWPHNPACILCDQEFETAVHLCKDCIFTKEVWMHLSRWLQFQSLPVFAQFRTISGWWRASSNAVDRTLRRTFNGIVITFWWFIWKERNRRTFQNIKEDALQIARSIKEHVDVLSLSRSF